MNSLIYKQITLKVPEITWTRYKVIKGKSNKRGMTQKTLHSFSYFIMAIYWA